MYFPRRFKGLLPEKGPSGADVFIMWASRYRLSIPALEANRISGSGTLFVGRITEEFLERKSAEWHQEE